MAEIVAKLHELTSLPPEIHWFCNVYSSQSLSPVKNELPIANDLYLRQQQVCECLTLFGFDGEDAERCQRELEVGIQAQLARCDHCVVGYYKSRKKLVEQLRNEHDEDEVAGLVGILNDKDFIRIKRGLNVATQKLKATDPSERSKNVLDLSQQLLMFEALCCEALLADETLLRQYFQEPFTLMQTNRKLKVLHYAPAATAFLFDKDHDRSSWATYVWEKYKNLPTEEDFDFAIRDPLLQNMQSAFGVVTDLSSLHRLWHGVGLIINKLDNNLITHSLRALDIDIYKLALEHLQYDADGFLSVLRAIRKLLEIAPVDFWDAMGAISPTTVIEQIFNNPRYDSIIQEANGSADYDSSALNDVLSWVRPFMASLKTDHQARACRSLEFQLLDRLQADRFPSYARLECKRIGLVTLAWTLSNCNKDSAAPSHTGRILTAETLSIASDYIEDIISIPGLPARHQLQESCGEICVKIIKAALALECKTLRMDQDALKNNKELPVGFSSYSPAIWDAVVQHLDRGNVTVARAALVGINDLTGLEKFKIGADETYSKEKSGFNLKFGRLTHLVCQILERINDFDPTDLDKLFRHSETATALVASLFSPDPTLYEAGVNLIKSISAESARREAIGHLLQVFLETTLNAFSWATRRIARNKTYASCPRMLKTSADVLDILCDSQVGLLRTRPLSSLPEMKALETFWEHQWDGLRVIYETTEDWGREKVADSSDLKQFCRDTMQLSERLFDQYSVFANAIKGTTSIKQEGVSSEDQCNTVAKELLQHPGKVMEAMVKWLRLRDEYLVKASVNLTKKVLVRLTEQGMTIAEGPYMFLEQVLKNGPQAKTKLQPQEKAEIARALEENLGHPIAGAEPDREQSDTLSDRYQKPLRATKKRTKASTIDLDAWRSKAKHGQVIEIPDDDQSSDSGRRDPELSSFSRSSDLLKDMKAASATAVVRNKAAPLQDRKSSTLPAWHQKPGQAVKSGIQSDAERVLFREKREKERDAKKKRDAETLALVKKKASIGISGQTVGEGSALGNLGVRGKDHAPKTSGMMVSSGSESESDESLDEQLFGPKTAKVPDALRDYNAERALPAKIRGPIKKARQARSAKDMRARLAPDLTPLHKTILSWDFFHSGDFPPGSHRDNYTLVSSTFRAPVDYQSTFEPLLILEAWQGFLKSKEEGGFKTFEVKVANRMTVDAFLEVSTTMPLTEGRELGINEADIVLMSKGQSPVHEAQQPHCLARVFKIGRKKGTMDITYRVNIGNGLVTSMVPGSTLYAVKVSSITPLEREYGALLGLKYFDLCDEIIRAKPSPILDYTETQLGPLVANYKINIAQAKAVRSAVDNDAFTLIQGPPGSGKTSTIVAIVGALLSGVFVEKGVPIARPRLTNGSTQRPGNNLATKKLLVCAPSNAAVDELVMRFKEGIKTVEGRFQKLSVIRLGRSDAINANVRDVTLEELVNAKLNLATGKTNGGGDEVHKIMMAHKATSEELTALRTRVDEVKAKGAPVSPEDDRQFEVLKRRKQQLSNQIDSARDNGDIVARDAEMSRRRVQQEILDGAHVICATLSGSGHEMFQGLNIEFETVVIDEAAQSIELSALIPLKYGCSKCILVGDPKQLPPTVLSREAARFQYEQSLFVRMQANHPKDVHLLDTQYRMHPEISIFPSNTFYDSRLLDGPGMAKLRTRPWHQSAILGPYRFFDVQGTHYSAPKGHSLVNIAEIEVAMKLFDRLMTDCRGYDFNSKIGIITPYKSQLRELRARFSQRYGDAVVNSVDFNTTDAFQGRESEIIIFSCVRASVNKGIGFMSDIRRMNVGITRAKCSLWILGNSQSLMQGEFWGRLIQDAKARDRYTSGDLSTLLKKPLLTLDSKAACMSTSLPQRSTPTTSTPISTIRDWDMVDAPAHNVPVLAGFTTTNGRVPSPKNMAVDIDMPDSADAVEYRPSGGGNGLNTLQNCGFCGSYAHFENRCDKRDVPEKGEECYRCGDKKHRKWSCTAERCLACGGFGHPETTCSGNPLSSKKREWLAKKEAEHKVLMQRAPDVRRLKNVNGHDPKVPLVRSTESIPPPIRHGVPHQNNDKRKREPSPPPPPPHPPPHLPLPTPPPGAPTGPRNQPLGPQPNGSLPPRPPNNVRPPAKKKKGVDPFIRPKRR